MSAFLLPKHVFVCRTGAHVVLLDLRQDKYLALEAAKTRSLSELVPGWPPPLTHELSGHSRPEEEEPAGATLVEMLAQQGLLTRDQRIGKRSAALCVDPPVTEVTADAYDDHCDIGTGSIASFLIASVRSALALRFLRIERVVMRVQSRLEKRSRNGAPLDRHALARLVTIYSRLRPFAFTAKDACLFESLTLINFLSRQGLSPKWVFGVQTEPFAAHCWVQLGDTVLNDTVEHVRGYTPIMAI